jgi:hypothetical protein
MKSILISEEIHKLLKDHCKENGLVMKPFLERAIKEAIKKGTEVPNQKSIL